MIRKLICPTDFSTTAANATAYAAKLAQLSGAELLLIHVQADTDPQLISIAEERLKEMSADIHKMFHITTDYEHDVAEMPISEILSGLDPTETMIVMGTNGADDLEQLLYGSTTYSVVQKLRCPIWVIPENVSYGSIRKIAFAWDYTEANRNAFLSLQGLEQAVHAGFLFLHISRHHTAASQEVFEINKKKVLELSGYDKQRTVLYFKQIFAHEITETLNDYMIESDADLLAVTSTDHQRTIKLFREQIVKTLTQTVLYPLLVIPV
jgi:nucleotide-binding universal stress UspA family protein